MDAFVMVDNVASLPRNEADMALRHRIGHREGELETSRMKRGARKRRTTPCSLPTSIWLVAGLLVVHSIHLSCALVGQESRIQSFRHGRTPITMRLSSSSLRSASATSRSPLFQKARSDSATARHTASATFRSPLFQKPRPGSSTARHMVLTTPESIIEQASTQNLLDDLIDESVRTSARRPIMMQFDPSSGWIWRRWKGTVFSETWHSAVAKMAWATIIFFIFRANPGAKENLSGFSILWGQLLSVTTFTLTFFLNQSYALWRKCYELSRRLQGRLNDLGMTLAAHAARKTPASPTEPSTYTNASRQLLELVSRYIRIFNILTYASFTRSHRPILTPRGMRRLVERGLLTAQEREVLVDAEIPATQRHNAIILWITRLFVEGRQAGHIVGGAGFENQFVEKIHVIRAQYGAIGDELQGRMPLAYAHIVQVLVDVVLFMYPIMSFSSGMSPFLGVLGTGLLTMFYQGLFDLAKQFLDPYDNENYGKGDDPLCVDTLVAETNSGSVRWMYGFEQQPFSSQRIRDGELFEYLLPVRGYSVEELAQMEGERLQKEREQQEKREEAERLKREEEVEAERLKREAEELEVVAALPSNETMQVNATAVVLEVDAVEVSEDADQQGIEIEGLLLTAADEKGKAAVVHKVYTLEDGTPVTLAKSAEKSDQEENATNVTQLDQLNATVNGDFPVEAKNQTADDLALIQTVRDAEEDEDEDDTYIHSLMDFEEFQDLDWYDEVGEDGKEYRLSEQLADEGWEEEEEKEAPLSYEDYTSRRAEIMEAAENEMLETAEILKAAPGVDIGVSSKETKSFDSGPRGPELSLKRPDRKEPPKYDQTKLDGISQLWGLPPEDPSALQEYPEPVSLNYDDYRFEGISQLWGETPTPPSTSDDSSPIVGGGSFAGINQLWGNDSPIDLSGTGKTVPRTPSPTGNGGGGSVDITSLPFDVDSSVFAGLEWHEEVGPDGKEYRLSEMLADEAWEEEIVPEEAAPMTFADFTKKVEVLREAAEDEKLATEAILKAPPGADSWDDPSAQLDRLDHRKNKHEEDSPANSTELADSLEALEMDSNEEFESSGRMKNPFARDIWAVNATVPALEVIESPTDESSKGGEVDAIDLEEDNSGGDIHNANDQ